MSRLIDADKLATHVAYEDEDGHPCEFVYKCDIDAAQSVPEGGRRGFWKQDDTWKDLYFCSACIGRDHRNNPKYKYCPDCGARMDERERSE